MKHRATIQVDLDEKTVLKIQDMDVTQVEEIDGELILIFNKKMDGTEKRIKLTMKKNGKI